MLECRYGNADDEKLERSGEQAIFEYVGSRKQGESNEADREYVEDNPHLGLPTPGRRRVHNSRRPFAMRKVAVALGEFLTSAVICSRRQGSADQEGLACPHPQKSLRLYHAEVFRKLCGISMDMAPSRQANELAEDESVPSVMMVTSAQRVGHYGGEVFSTGDMAMTKIRETSRAGFSQILKVFGRRHAYRWYEVEVALF